MLIQVLIAILLVGSGPYQSGQDVQSLMPPPDTAAGWQWDLEPEMYDPETLFEYINGEAEHYNDYNFVEMVTASHSRVEDQYASFTIDIYDMDSPLNAFGIYSSHRRPELTFESIGEEAIASELNIMFYKGRFFIQVSAGSMEEIVTSAIRKQAEQLASKIEATMPPTELSLLPAEDQIPRTLEYLARGLLAQAAFEHAMEARYTLPSGECKAFVVMKDSEEEALAAVAQFKSNLMRQGQVRDAYTPEESSSLIAETEYYGKITVRTYSTFVLGITGYEVQEEADTLVGKIIDSLK